MNYYRELIKRNLDKGILLDTTPLLLLIVGIYDEEWIHKFKHTSEIFTDRDYQILAGLVDKFRKIVTTPNILTEACNLLGQAPEKIKIDFLKVLAILAKKFSERRKSNKKLFKQRYFTKFGLTDSSIIEDAKDKYLVLTTDFPLSGYLEHIGADVINFNHIRFGGIT
jgi:hypothetical protein